MKYVDEYREPALARRLLDEIAACAARTGGTPQRPLQIMEVCGGHTHSIFRYGLKDLIPRTIEFVHGPGCPVCVLPMGRVDDSLTIARQPHVIFTTFGDAMRVPGSTGSLLSERAEGADVRMVYSPLDALQIARDNPDREVVFFALGFETTMPSTALTVLQAGRECIDNFSLFCNHITIVPTLKAILDSPGAGIDGFLGPGHVAMVIGAEPFEFIAARYARPLVITGFEPTDILEGLLMLLRQIETGTARVKNQYTRVVNPAGNTPALEAITRVFELREFFEWRGLGSIDHSGIRLRFDYARFDAERRFSVPGAPIADPKSCQCGEVLKGAIKPFECKVFGQACTPQTPLGALMVSSEGACSAYYLFARRDDQVQQVRA
ncbi:protein required for maturation of hydrogenases [Paraburkholderia ribeironis]|uniref:Hydrogenase maturation factor n=1 Tax=Paraburkholderia ribeironis TaxID=1247936 RepID=A0A1N7RT09_9BURK|nr:hydrogenase formation protein HypD [Paraburkholderia ribeironis]SIT38216.1 protein required for maturation of hydrogenases [Paraburkholderia ribeironis]